MAREYGCPVCLVKTNGAAFLSVDLARANKKDAKVQEFPLILLNKKQKDAKVQEFSGRY
ncbi:hypothetical protein J25TS5_32170 [Paenibacillus faecis]|uniref:hypothetical protein n=1 Tax=Paenibacillus faecis TaxID=862114 RepID=UPI001B1C348E|nr:hypothetical protein [Paenibacillus faecis]GIO86285.1 hypothetical protein J25TS5_32170 [Paenibacillus faecis]